MVRKKFCKSNIKKYNLYYYKMNDHTTKMNDSSETTDKKVNPKHKKYYDTHKRQIYIRNLLKIKNKPSKKKWEEWDVKEED